MDISDLEKKLGIEGMSADEQMAMVIALQKSAEEKSKQARDETIGKSAELVIQGLKKIKSDIETRFSELNSTIQTKVSSLQDGKDGLDGKDGKDGRDGKQGLQGLNGKDGRDGRDGVDGVDGVSVTSAHIDFDGSLIIGLSSGVELNVGEVVAPDLAERIKVITNGGGTSQSVLDTLASLQSQINTLIPSQTGNSGKFLTTNGTTTSWATVTGGGGGLSYQGTWNASTNTPTLTSSTGINGYYYVVSTSGSTNLNGITDWVTGDWALYNGTSWQKIDQTNLVTSVNSKTGAVSLTYTDVNAIGSITSNDGSVSVSTASGVADLSVSVAASTTNVICQVRNSTGATLTKGTAVYISGATGQIPTVSKALATSDTYSAQTLGLLNADLANNSNGYVTIIGLIAEIDTSAYTDGQQLYLSGTTAGTLTGTKTYAPTHLVYVAVVEYAHAVHGKLFVKVQNGYELDEIHNVSAQSPSNGQTIIYNASTSLWEKANLTAGTGIGVSNGAGSITVSNSGVTSAVAGTGISVSGSTGAVTITNSAPDQTVALTGGTGITTSGTYPNFTITNSAPDQTVAITAGTGITKSGTYPNFTITNSAPDQTVSLTGSGTTSITGTYPNFTITSNDAYTGTVTSVTGTSPVASSGGTTPAISLASGYGDTQNPYASKTANYVLAAPNGTAGVPTFRAIVASDIPTLNQNTTGTSANITATSNSTLTTLSSLSLPYSQLSGTVPTWNQNTTGTASNVTGTVAIANGGTGQTTQAASLTALTGTQTSGYYVRSNGTNSILSAIQAADVPTLNQNTTGSAASLSATLAISSGGTGQTTASSAFNALSPITSTGDLIIGNGTNSATRLAIGTSGYVLTSNGTTATWSASSGGGGNPSVVSKTTTYTITTSDSTVLCDATSAAFTVTLPTAVSVSGKTYTVKKIDSSTNAITIATTSSQTIDTISTQTLGIQNAWLVMQSDGSNWQIIG
jgi:hypothetical protein